VNEAEVMQEVVVVAAPNYVVTTGIIRMAAIATTTETVRIVAIANKIEVTSPVTTVKKAPVPTTGTAIRAIANIHTIQDRGAEHLIVINANPALTSVCETPAETDALPKVSATAHCASAVLDPVTLQEIVSLIRTPTVMRSNREIPARGRPYAHPRNQTPANSADRETPRMICIRGIKIQKTIQLLLCVTRQRVGSQRAHGNLCQGLGKSLTAQQKLLRAVTHRQRCPRPATWCWQLFSTAPLAHLLILSLLLQRRKSILQP
jgi:hypothetical protein